LIVASISLFIFPSAAFKNARLTESKLRFFALPLKKAQQFG